VNWKKTLIFPDDAKLSPDSRNLIQSLITDSSKRLNFEQIKAHPFFRSVKWDSIRNTKAPIVPNVTSEIDTQNFDKFEDVEPAANDQEESHNPEAQSSFIGYTFKRPEQPKALGASFFDGP